MATKHAMTVCPAKGSQLWGQVTKCMWWMPWRLQAMKDVAACEKLRGSWQTSFDPEMSEWGNPARKGHRALNT